jgi:hypothetical protein
MLRVIPVLLVALGCGGAPPQPVAATPIPGRGEIVGSVRGKSGQPLASATVTIEIESGMLTVISDAAGQYVVHDVPVGRHAVHAQLEGHSFETTVDVHAGGRTELDCSIPINAGGSL